ncbi:hypothetical protein GF336_04585 [Candidatus Woesearchaeota archaeon]|nr:hypothetical protein [Candidatus Woesearchaeota archaeon]
MNSMVQTIKAMRIERSFFAVLMIFIPAAFTGKINASVYLLVLLCVIAYTIGGLYNAKVDNDYDVKHANQIMAFLFITGLVISLKDIVLFFTFFMWFALGLVYNKYSRFVLFGDNTVLAVTHGALPVLSSSFLLGLDIWLSLKLAGFLFVNMWLAIPLKNLNNFKKDEMLGYHTLMTMKKNGRSITEMLLESYFISMFFAYFLFDLGDVFLAVLMFLFILRIFVFRLLREKKFAHGYRLNKIATLIFLFGIIASRTREEIVFVPIVLAILYLIYQGILFANNFTVLKNQRVEM